MHIRISTTNSKLGYQIPSISLPPQHSCRPDAPCAKGCYGKRGNFRFANVQEAHLGNYEFYESNPQAYFAEIQSYLNDSLVCFKYFRWHAVGDIVDARYFQGMIENRSRMSSSEVPMLHEEILARKQFRRWRRRDPDEPKNRLLRVAQGLQGRQPERIPRRVCVLQEREPQPRHTRPSDTLRRALPRVPRMLVAERRSVGGIQPALSESEPQDFGSGVFIMNRTSTAPMSANRRMGTVRRSRSPWPKKHVLTPVSYYNIIEAYGGSDYGNVLRSRIKAGGIHMGMLIAQTREEATQVREKGTGISRRLHTRV